MKLGAISVAAVTPRRNLGYEADLAATLELVDYLCASGAHGIALLGSTGEFLHLNPEHRAHLVRMAVKRSRVPVLAGVTHSTFDGTVLLAEQAAQAGAAARSPVTIHNEAAARMPMLIILLLSTGPAGRVLEE